MEKRDVVLVVRLEPEWKGHMLRLLRQNIVVCKVIVVFVVHCKLLWGGLMVVEYSAFTLLCGEYFRAGIFFFELGAPLTRIFDFDLSSAELFEQNIVFGWNSYVYGILVMVNVVIKFIGEDYGVVSRGYCDY